MKLPLLELILKIEMKQALMPKTTGFSISGTTGWQAKMPERLTTKEICGGDGGMSSLYYPPPSSTSVQLLLQNKQWEGGWNVFFNYHSDNEDWMLGR